MKLDSTSMDKLIFLIIMTVKKEFYLTSSPLELYSLTLGNLQTLASHTVGTDSAILLERSMEQFVSVAGKYSFMQYM